MLRNLLFGFVMNGNPSRYVRFMMIINIFTDDDDDED